jgi:SAM-dependent methyltransferase
LAGAGQVVALDEWWQCLARNRQRGGVPVAGDAIRLPIKDAQFDYLFALDVLEHLPDDHVIVREWARVLKPGGRMVINVPAMDCLWSPHDVQMGHYRRYSKKKLSAVLEANGLVCERLVYSNFFLFPFAWLSFKLKLHHGSETNPEAHVPVSKPILWIITLCYRLEAAWLKWFSFPVGGSLVAIAKKS